MLLPGRAWSDRARRCYQLPLEGQPAVLVELHVRAVVPSELFVIVNELPLLEAAVIT